MKILLLAALLWLPLSPMTAMADTSDVVVPDKEVFNRSINRKYLSIVLYPDGTFERRATFFPAKGKKHWATVAGKWSKTTDGQFCLTQTSAFFHDPTSKNLFTDGSCLTVYRNKKGSFRVAMKHEGGAGFDGPAKVSAAYDGFHYPSARALEISGAKLMSPASFFKAAQGRKFVVNQWIGLANFLPARKKVFEMSMIQKVSAVVHDRRGKATNAVLATKGKSMCTEFTFPKLWAKGCGTLWQTPDGRIYIVSDESGYAYAGGQFQ